MVEWLPAASGETFGDSWVTSRQDRRPEVAAELAVGWVLLERRISFWPWAEVPPKIAPSVLAGPAVWVPAERQLEDPGSSVCWLAVFAVVEVPIPASGL